jgi:large subunit ribosomal protein L15
MKLKKRRKSSRMHGRGMGSHGWGARKKHVGTSGHSGGKGMSGTGKKAGHKKTLVEKLYGHSYFGKQGITSRGTERKHYHVINLKDIQKDLDSIKKKFLKNGVLEMENYRILGDGEIKEKLTIKCLGTSKSAREKIEKAGGKVILNRVYEEAEEKKSSDKNKETKE